MWEIATGPIPDGLYVLHRCDNPPCFNPDHLFLGTPMDNMRDKMAKGRHRFGNAQATKTHCPQGHEYDEANTGYRKTTGEARSRYCRACARERMARKRLVAG
jgi:hypothetical protein